jgi:hypothetical protein
MKGFSWSLFYAQANLIGQQAVAQLENGKTTSPISLLSQISWSQNLVII